MGARGVSGPVVAITGTPGTGKTAVAERLIERGFPVLDLKRYIGDPRFDQGADADHHDSIILDQDALADHLHDHLLDDLGIEGAHDGPVYIESHFAHELDMVDRILVLRCRPSVLKGRLASRDWPDTKVQENLEAEALDLILQEAVLVRDAAEEMDEAVDVGEIDTTEADIGTVVERVIALTTAAPETLEIGMVDWSDEVLEWY